MHHQLTRRPTSIPALLFALVLGVLVLAGLFAAGPATHALAATGAAAGSAASSAASTVSPAAETIALPATETAANSAPGVKQLAAGSVDDFEFLSWDSEWQVGIETTPGGKDRSYAEVTETIVPVFPEQDQNRGIIRTVPLAIGDGRMEASDVDVRDEDGNEVEFDSDVSGGELVVEIGDDEYVHGEQTYVLTYTLHDVIADLGNPEVQEFYANLLPTTRAQPIGTFSARVTLAPELAEKTVGEASCYLGDVGATEPCEVTIDGLTYDLNPGAMPPDETVTINIGFEPGTVPQLSLLDRIGWFPLVVAFVPPVGLVVSLVFLVLQWRKSRHTRGGVVVSQYEPRADLPPQLAAQVIPSLSLQAFPASILHAAVKGALRIEESVDAPEQPVAGTTAKLRAPQLRRLSGGASLHPVERQFVDEVLFADAGYGSSADAGQGSVTDADSIGEPVPLAGNAAIGEAYTEFGKDVQNAAADAGFLAKSPVATAWKNRTIWVTIVSLVVAIAAFIILVIVNGGGLMALTAGLFFAFVAVLVISALLPTKLRTAEGAAAYDHLRGLRDYIKLSEADRIRALQSTDTAERIDGPTGEARIIEVYEQLLPYAVLFGLDRKWAKELQAHYEAADSTPFWLYGYQPVMFGAAMTHVKQSAHAAMPASSGGGASSSGFAGGGFAGGGAGGGSVGGR
ncbi:DUF2207 domain-containing protein [Gulosibacter chungangensis]|uniref:DUF2207 domain-containing protein n=1 Tax=Gulosibacter chungangensis TaxID=979746 RepID=A0A7J5BFL7_9MICO|nr:DUF2207 domain-containing protein [Gulosibacter chungangensis]KAB1645024.1 DUF2207 domain-containing protein [Gulosibacter chungangensis]